MRMLGLAGIAALTIATPAWAGVTALGELSSTITPYAPGDEIVPNVVPGDQIAIACGAVEQRSAESDVRVVLTISAMPGESAPGYKKVLATDAQLLKDAVRVRIPDVPDLEDHTVDLNVYVVDDKGSQHCNAGQMKIS
jgi:hypothetical protein